MRSRPAILGLGAVVAAGLGAALIGRRTLAILESTPDPWNDADLGPLNGDYTTVTMSDGAEIGVVIAGPEDGAPVVLSHGILANTRFWTLVAPQLVSGGYRVIAYDQRGHGGSTLGDEEFTVDRLGRDLADIVTSLCDRPAILVGHSMGAISVLAHLCTLDQLQTTVARAVLVAPLSRSRPLSRLAKIFMAKGNPTVASRDLSRLVALVTYGKKPPLSLVDLGIDITSTCPDSTAAAAVAGLAEFDLRPGLGQIRVDVDVLCGTDDRVTPPSYSREIVAAIPNATVTWIEDEGHQVPLTSPDEIVSAVQNTKIFQV